MQVHKFDVTQIRLGGENCLVNIKYIFGQTNNRVLLYIFFVHQDVTEVDLAFTRFFFSSVQQHVYRALLSSVLT